MINTQLSNMSSIDAFYRSMFFDILTPREMARSDALLSKWINEDLIGDNRLIGLYMAAKLDALAARIDLLPIKYVPECPSIEDRWEQQGKLPPLTKQQTRRKPK